VPGTSSSAPRSWSSTQARATPTRWAPEDDETFTTLDLTAKYFKPIWNAQLHASAKVIKRTRTLGLIECDITDEAGSLVAKIYSSCMVLRGPDARGR
jgi:uncharacterized protein (TIGR00369 family)